MLSLKLAPNALDLTVSAQDRDYFGVNVGRFPSECMWITKLCIREYGTPTRPRRLHNMGLVGTGWKTQLSTPQSVLPTFTEIPVPDPFAKAGKYTVSEHALELQSQLNERYVLGFSQYFVKRHTCGHHHIYQRLVGGITTPWHHVKLFVALFISVGKACGPRALIPFKLVCLSTHEP